MKYILCLVAGAGLGYYAAKLKIEKEYTARLDEEIEKTRIFFKELHDREKRIGEIDEMMVNGSNSVVTESLEDDYRPTKEEIDQTRKMYEERMKAKREQEKTEEETLADAANALVDYRGISAKPSNMPAKKREEVIEKPPYSITFEEFDGENDYEKISVNYYQGDKVVADDADQALSDTRVKQVIGRENLDRFDEFATEIDPDIIYIRCEKFKIDFEVARSHGTFAEEVDGLLPTGD